MTNLTIPECRDELQVIARQLYARGHADDLATRIEAVIENMFRRPAARRALPESNQATPELLNEIHEFANSHPWLSYRAIGEMYGVSIGRVSEAVAGKR